MHKDQVNANRWKSSVRHSDPAWDAWAQSGVDRSTQYENQARPGPERWPGLGSYRTVTVRTMTPSSCLAPVVGSFCCSRKWLPRSVRPLLDERLACTPCWWRALLLAGEPLEPLVEIPWSNSPEAPSWACTSSMPWSLRVEDGVWEVEQRTLC